MFFRNSTIVRNYVLVISLMLNSLAGLYFLKNKIKVLNYFAFQENVKSDSGLVKYEIELQKYFNARVQLFELLPSGKNDIVFVGNSITEGFLVNEIFSDLNIKNRGIASSKTGDVIKRLNYIIKTKPAKIFLEIGVNDIKWGGGGATITDDSIFWNVKQIVLELKTSLPGTRIYFQSILPTTLEFARFNDRILSLNIRIRDYCQNENIEYVDLASGFMLNGSLNPAYTYDGLHLNGNGYYLWKGMIEKYVRE